MTTNKTLGLYIHIPFCVSKCNYCDFLSFPGLSPNDHDRYTESLLLELDWYSGEQTLASGLPGDRSEYIIDSVFIGGGTPSLISETLIEKILKRVSRNFTLAKDCEITIEANPNTIDRRKLTAYRVMGINRLSIGAQSLDDELLAYMGRLHSAEEFIMNFEEARAAGFENINVDLMFGIPGQTLDSWAHTLKGVMALEPEHLSFYGLKIEEGTPFYTMSENKSLIELSDDLDRQMYATALQKLSSHRQNGTTGTAYEHYELSNAAIPGYACRHNLKYWSMSDYLGIGLGAHSYIGQERFSNTKDLNRYEESTQSRVEWRHKNSIDDEISEYIFTGMRKVKGISFKDYEMRFGESIFKRFEKQLNKLIKSGLIDSTSGGIKLSLKGIDISNYVLSEFV